ncbi:hypothetical protein KZZ52_36850 [Dactylosporangium sp. AC04546]|uniref:hypothetical protein n=1 Tax=Dactylosporangium sp. AC04546 TaxID=2862460 RepID=UPI001EDDEFF3|nr:hypothetical protein [Dactylosporangium sp. AC04546]WVK79535.1 hypothetical protein KZZ52_36850 [Dactylosporangium sp. AC04546]
MSDYAELVEKAPIVPLVDGKLYVLPNPYPLDGRICTHPLDARGFATQNCYLFVEGKRAVLVDTGFSLHEKAMIGRLESLLGSDVELELCVLRLGEYYGTCNVRPIVEHFGIRTIYSTRPDGVESTDFRPEHVPYGSPNGTGAFAEVKGVMLRGSGQIDLGNGRILKLLRPPLRLLSTNWLYDVELRTLLTADHFTYLWQPTLDGPWVADASEPMPSEQHVRDFMAATRYWWLPGARTNQMVADLDKIFDGIEVDRIGPGYGRVIDGREPVREHVALLRRVLEAFPSERAIGLNVGYKERSKRAPMEAGVQ